MDRFVIHSNKDKVASIVNISNAFTEASPQLMPGSKVNHLRLNDMDRLITTIIKNEDAEINYMNQNFEAITNKLDVTIDLDNDIVKKNVETANAFSRIQNEMAGTMEHVVSFAQKQEGAIMNIIADVKALKNYDVSTNAQEMTLLGMRIASQTALMIGDAQDAVPAIGGSIAAAARFTGRSLAIAADEVEKGTFTNIMGSLMNGWKDLKNGNFDLSKITSVIDGSETGIQDVIEKLRTHDSGISKIAYMAFHKIISGVKMEHKCEMLIKVDEMPSGMAFINVKLSKLHIILMDIMTGSKVIITLTDGGLRTMSSVYFSSVDPNGLLVVFGVEPSLVGYARESIDSVVWATHLYRFYEIIGDELRKHPINESLHILMSFIGHKDIPNSYLSHKSDIFALDGKSVSHKVHNMRISESEFLYSTVGGSGLMKQIRDNMANVCWTNVSPFRHGALKGENLYIVAMPAIWSNSVCQIGMTFILKNDKNKRNEKYYSLNWDDNKVNVVDETKTSLVLSFSIDKPSVIITTNCFNMCASQVSK